jgi:hypothetical protein
MQAIQTCIRYISSFNQLRITKHYYELLHFFKLRIFYIST